MEHPWMNCTAASLHPYPLSMVFSHLPHFENAVKQLKQDRGSNCGLGQIFSKVNMSQGEAQAAIQQHLQPNSIPDDAQQLFKK